MQLERQHKLEGSRKGAVDTRGRKVAGKGYFTRIPSVTYLLHRSVAIFAHVTFLFFPFSVSSSIVEILSVPYIVSIPGTRVGTWRSGKEVICVSVRRWEGEMRPSLLAAPKCRPPSLSLSRSSLHLRSFCRRRRWIECETESRKGALSRLKVRARGRAVQSVCVGSPFSLAKSDSFRRYKNISSLSNSLGSAPSLPFAALQRRESEEWSEGERGMK